MPICRRCREEYKRWGSRSGFLGSLCNNCHERRAILDKELEEFPERQVTHDLAVYWWNSRADNTATCDICNSSVLRGDGYLVDTELYCEDCGKQKLSVKGEPSKNNIQLQPDANNLTDTDSEFNSNRIENQT